MSKGPDGLLIVSTNAVCVVEGRRGWRGTSGLAALTALAASLLLGACAGEGEPPAVAVPDAEPPRMSTGTEGERIVENAGAQEHLLVRRELPRRGAPTLLFLDGRAVASAPVETRAVEDVPLGTVGEGDPLLWRVEDGHRRPVGRVISSERPLLGQLENTGRAALGQGGRTFFAPALRPELVAFDPDGELRWRAKWRPDEPLQRPRFSAGGGSLEVEFSVIQHALAVGPDGRAYVLASPGPDRLADHLLVFDRDGVLVRQGVVEGDGGVFVDRRGRVFSVSREAALDWTSSVTRTVFRPFRLPSLGAESEYVDLELYRGQVVVVNFWASWCPPCRREIPELEKLFLEWRDQGVVVIGLNEDVDPSAGIAFLDELGGVSYPNAAGLGRLRADYGYRGLPFTVVLDREHRVFHTLFGFGSSIAPVRDAVIRALSEDQP